MKIERLTLYTDTIKKDGKALGGEEGHLILIPVLY